MIKQEFKIPPELFEHDETAWLETMATLIQQGQLADLDYPHLSEFLSDMAKRDRREVKNRLAVLIMHILKWNYQPEKRSPSWRRTIVAQRQALKDLLSSGTLRNHAESILAATYPDAVEQTVAETELPLETFPKTCPYSLDQFLSADLSEM